MQDQLQAAIRLTETKTVELESDLRSEREFLGRLIPTLTPNLRKHSNTAVWLGVLKAMVEKPMRHEHVIDYIDEHELPLRRGAARVWLSTRKNNGIKGNELCGLAVRSGDAGAATAVPVAPTALLLLPMLMGLVVRFGRRTA